MESYDLAIIGAGGAGLAGAMYAARLGLKTIVFGTTSSSELPVGGVITTTHMVENYPGFKNVSGVELAKKLEEHARDYDLVNIKTEKVTEVKKDKKGFKLKSTKGEYFSKAIIFATGTKWKELDVAGSKDFLNRGLHYCALCDGPLYKDKIVGIVGGSDSAIKDALVLAKHAKKVYIIYRGEKVRAEPINIKRVEKERNIEIINKANVTELHGDKFLKRIKLDREFKGRNELLIDGLFVAIGHVILSDLAKNLGVKLNEKGEIIINHKTSETNLKGVFAAGDVTDKDFKQLITGVADSCTAAFYANEYIKSIQ